MLIATCSWLNHAITINTAPPTKEPNRAWDLRKKNRKKYWNRGDKP